MTAAFPPLRYYPRLFKMALETRPFDFLLLVFFTIGGALLPMLTIYSTESAVSQVQSLMGKYSSLDQIRGIGFLSSILLLMGSIVLRNLFASYQDAFGRSVVYWMDFRVDSDINRKLLKVDAAFFDNARRLDELKNAENAVDHPYQIITRMVNVVGSLILVVGMSVLAAQFHYLLPIALIILAMPGAILNSKFNKRIHWLNVELAPVFRRDDYLRNIVRDRKYAGETRLLQTGGFILGKWAEARRSIASARSKVYVKKSLAQSLADAASLFIIGFAWMVIAFQTILGRVSLGRFVASIQIVNNLMGGFAALFNDVGVIIDSNAYLEDTFKILDLPEDGYAGALVRRQAASNCPASPNDMDLIEVKNVSFCYPGSEKFVLEDVCLRLERNTLTAIVGENGAGKSTLTKLLCRMYDPTKGGIFLNGVDIREYDKEEYHRLVSVLFQDFIRYEMTVAENVGMGNIARLGDRAAIQRASTKAGLAEVLEVLPAGIDQQLGRLFYDSLKNGEGMELSTGQWQKVALARTYMREDAPFLILDEPTSSMDALGELRFIDNLFQLCRGKIACIVSHRFSTVKACSNIIVMDKGRIIESGTHQRLHEAGGLYSRMFDAQAQMYA